MTDWKYLMQAAVTSLLSAHNLPEEHILKTPQRVVAAYEDLFSGCTQDPQEILLQAKFSSKVDEMVTIKDVAVYSLCLHHLLPFFGRATFAYIPDGEIVGYSKIPRFIHALAKRPQVQEELAQQIVDAFRKVVACKGCAVLIRAYHMCALMRGVEEHQSYMETTALKGVFKEGTAKAEFLQSAQGMSVWGK